MKKYTLSILTVAIVSFLSLAFMPAAQFETYCNQRYNYCVTYPDILTAERSADNGDGIYLKHANGLISGAVAGSYNPMEWTADDILELSYAETLGNPDLAVKGIQKTVLPHGVQAVYLMRDQYHLVKVHLLEESYVLLEMTAPANAKMELENLAQQISMDISM